MYILTIPLVHFSEWLEKTAKLYLELDQPLELLDLLVLQVKLAPHHLHVSKMASHRLSPQADRGQRLQDKQVAADIKAFDHFHLPQN